MKPWGAPRGLVLLALLGCGPGDGVRDMGAGNDIGTAGDIGSVPSCEGQELQLDISSLSFSLLATEGTNVDDVGTSCNVEDAIAGVDNYLPALAGELESQWPGLDLLADVGPVEVCGSATATCGTGSMDTLDVRHSDYCARLMMGTDRALPAQGTADVWGGLLGIEFPDVRIRWMTAGGSYELTVWSVRGAVRQRPSGEWDSLELGGIIEHADFVDWAAYVFERRFPGATAGELQEFRDSIPWGDVLIDETGGCDAVSLAFVTSGTL